ncbi:MAG TPA: hypothetical protein VH253_00680 [Phycisphaerae bacterium]|nr:hypothetical protein [Phycisphaerae bacterium]
MDTLFAILLAGAMATMLVVTIVKQGHAEREMQRRRAAYRAVEDAADDLLTGHELPAEARVEWLPAAAGQASGRRWARLTDAGATLVVLAPDRSGGGAK